MVFEKKRASAYNIIFSLSLSHAPEDDDCRYSSVSVRHAQAEKKENWQTARKQ